MMEIKAFEKLEKKIYQAIQSFQAYNLNLKENSCSFEYPVFINDFEWFYSKKGKKVQGNFKNEYEKTISLNNENEKYLRSYLLKVYVNGLSHEIFRLKFIQKELLEKGANTEDKTFVKLSNIIHGLVSMTDSISSYLFHHTKFVIPEITEDGYNISGDYFNPFELIKPTSKPKENCIDNNNEKNDLINSTIEDWLFEFKEREVLKEPHYNVLFQSLSLYLKNGKFPKLEQEIKVGRVNKKLLGWHLNRILHSEGKGIEIELLSFAKNNISTFKDLDFSEEDIRKSNLYKYFTTKTK